MTPLAELRGITKRFGGVAALKGVDFELRAGEVHALLGENGAGKSTLMRVLGGEIARNGGEILVDGKPVHFAGPRQAAERGIAIIHQEMALAPDLSVAENIFLGELPAAIAWPSLRRRAAGLIARLGFAIDPAAIVSDLSVAHQQVVEIAKVLSRNARIIVFDEPTAVLAVRDAERLLAIIDGLRRDGVGVVYISHRLDEVFRIADRITVMKDGASVRTVSPLEVTVDDVIRMMVGRSLSALFGERGARAPGEELLRVEGLCDGKRIRDVGFAIRAGEIVGLGGLVGAGRTEVARMIFGADRLHSGRVFVGGRKVRIRKPRDAVRAGIALVPEDRKRQGVVLEMAIRINATMADMSPITSKTGFIRRARERSLVGKLADDVHIRMSGMDAPVSALSGGNQQKVVLAKWFHLSGRVVILDEPTRGVDVGAKAEIYTLVHRMAAEGKAVLVISSEHLELFGLCDRVLVMGEGRLRGELHPADYSEENLLTLAMRNDTDTDTMIPPEPAPLNRQREFRA